MPVGGPTATLTGVHRFGIRHHGPGSARSLCRALDELEPDAVLLELPSDAEPVLHLVADPAMRPPVALLAYALEHPEVAAFWPFAAFSPEWQAMQWAAARGVPVRAIDLALVHQLSPDGRHPEAHDNRRRRLVDPIAALAAAAGEDDPERWWEDVVEHRGGELAFAAVAEAMDAVREGDGADGLDARREAWMRRAIRSALADGARRVAVVVGAWHVPALSDDLLADRAQVRRDTEELRGLPKVKVGVTWVPWTHRRLAAGTGYGAGVTSPAWYAHVFAHPGSDGITRWFADAARVLRDHDLPVSPDHVIAATRLAETAASLRGRPRAGLSEVLDAATAVLGDGRSSPLALVHDRLVVGVELGEVPDHTPMVPLARDLTACQRAVRLRPQADARALELDLRNPLHLARSQLLHRLLAIDVPWGVPTEARRSTGTFRESWTVRWEPELSVQLVDASAYGTTVAAAATTALVERARAATTVAELTLVVRASLLADLPDALAPAVVRLADQAATDPSLPQAATDPSLPDLMDALGPLADALRYGDVRATDAGALRTVVDGLAVRIVAGLVPACTALDDDSAGAMADRLTSVHAAFVRLDHPARREAWPAALGRIAEQARVHGVLQGRATRLLHDAESWPADRVGRRLSRALSVGTPAPEGAAFVEGFLAGSGTVLLYDADLLALVDGWLATLPTESFTDVVPLLRRTFGGFEPAERRQLGSLVRGPARAGGALLGWDLDEDRAAAALATVRHLLGVPDA
jgi:hypothetical protein